MEKRDNEIFMQSHGRRYLAMQGKQLSRETISVKVRCGFHAVGQEKKGQCIDRKQKSIFKSEEWDVHFV